jgi:RsiW-degrading membrane proteinase PrsW (M82 family)
MWNKLKSFGARVLAGVSVGLGFASVSSAQTAYADSFALATDEVTGMKTALLAALAIPVAAGISILAVKWGAKYVIRVFKSLTG